MTGRTPTRFLLALYVQYGLCALPHRRTPASCVMSIYIIRQGGTAVHTRPEGAAFHWRCQQPPTFLREENNET